MKFSFSRKKVFFTPLEQQLIVNAIKDAEKRTSGEIRVFVESHCRFVDPLDRATEVFFALNMNKTDQRNGVLLYIATKDRQLAICGDQGIHEKVGDSFWSEKVKIILSHFNKESFAEGAVRIVTELGEALAKYFPFDDKSDKNELPDEIVFGR